MNEPVSLKISTVLQSRRRSLLRELTRLNRRIAKTQDRILQLEARIASSSVKPRQAA